LSDSDKDLLLRCRRGDEAAWKALVARHTGRVFGLAYRFTGRVDEAEDLTQDIFVKVFQNLSRFDGEEAVFPAWLLTLARHSAIDHLRRGRMERQALPPEALDTVPSKAEGPERVFEKAERAGLVRRGLRSLPHELREALILRDLEGLSYEEAAKAAHVPVGTLKSRVNRGRLELARRLVGSQRAD
jgi:RNA polymerase sigma-70 factor (ECF subfamily)